MYGPSTEYVCSYLDTSMRSEWAKTILENCIFELSYLNYQFNNLYNIIFQVVKQPVCLISYTNVGKKIRLF